MADKPKVQSAVEIAAEFRQELALLDEAAVDSMLSAWVWVESSLVDAMEAFAGRFEPGEALTPGQVLRMERYAALYAQVEVQLAALEGVAFGTLEAGTQQAVTLGTAQGVASLESLGVSVGFNRLPAAAVENVVSLARAGRPLAALVEPMYGYASAGMIQELVIGVALGLGPRQIARRMSQDGLTAALNHLLLVTRDQYNRAHRSAALETYRRSGVVRGYVRRCARQAGRTCIACVALDGEFYELASDFEEHPQGRCTMIPAVRGVDMRPMGSGREWFAALSDEEQIATMGRARWEAWQAGEMPWERMVARRTHPVWGVSVTPAAVGRKQGEGTRGRKARRQKPKVEVRSAAIEARERILGMVTGLEEEADSLATTISNAESTLAEMQARYKKIKDRDDRFRAEVSEYNMRRELHDQIKRARVALNKVEREMAVRHRQVLYVDNPLQMQVINRSSNSSVKYMDDIFRLVSNSVAANGNTVEIRGGRGRPYFSRGAIFISKADGARTLAHELGHALEYYDDAMLQRSLAFLDRRTQGESLQSLKKLTGGNYRSDERARPDNFIHPYMGKNYNGRASEIVSMGLEYFYANPRGLARDDPEMFDFIYNTLRGT